MHLISITDKRCATCRWWPGTREVKFMSQRPFKVKTDGNARCQAKGTTCSGGNACSRWAKWEKLP